MNRIAALWQVFWGKPLAYRLRVGLPRWDKVVISPISSKTIAVIECEIEAASDVKTEVTGVFKTGGGASDVDTD